MTTTQTTNTQTTNTQTTNTQTTNTQTTNTQTTNTQERPRRRPVIEAFTDGGCLGNPGPGGWAFHLTLPPGRVLEDSGAAAVTTNNRMELIAVIQALRATRDLPEAAAADVVVFTDSTYVQQGITSWIRRWRANGWLTAARQPVKNAKLWRMLDQVASETGARFRWVRGHAGDPRNERCHALVQDAIAAERDNSGRS